MAGNVTATSHIKHVDVIFKNVNEYVNEKIIKTVLVKSVENDSIILTKNIDVERCTHGSDLNILSERKSLNHRR